MNKFRQIINRNLYLSVTLILLVASIAFAGVTLGVLGVSSNVDQTSVGTIYLGEYEESQYSVVLAREIATWKRTVDYRIKFQGSEVALDLDPFVFLSTDTIESIQKDKTNPALFSLLEVDQEAFETIMTNQFTQDIMDHFDFDTFYDDLDASMEKLDIIKIYDLSDYLSEELKTYEIDTTEITNILAADVSEIIGKIASITIEPGSRFSLLETLANTVLSNNQLSIIASAMQKLTQNTNFSGFVFEQNYILPNWAEQGKNVRILLVNQYDFSFYNNLDYSFTVIIDQVDANTLSFSLQGYPYITNYFTTSVEQAPVLFQTIYIDNPDIDETTPGVIVTETDTEYTYHLLLQDGSDGKIISYMRTTTTLNGTPVTVKLYDEMYDAINMIYEENIVDKGGA